MVHQVEVVIASENVHKVREFREMLKAFKQLDVLSLAHFPNYIAPEETGVTIEENALIKARDAAKHLNKWVISDDTGLIVPALKGAPGVYSRRYAGPDATDMDNRKKLLLDMQGLDGEDRTAYYECCVVLCGPNNFEKIFVGKCEGVILTEERGRHGFGYDSLFVKYDYDKTFAELSESIKNRISHRAKAFEKLAVVLKSL